MLFKQPAEFKENIDIKNGLQSDDHKSQMSKKSRAKSFIEEGISEAGQLKIENERLQTQMLIIQ